MLTVLDRIHLIGENSPSRWQSFVTSWTFRLLGGIGVRHRPRYIVDLGDLKTYCNIFVGHDNEEEEEE
ncbi:hypothetical protein M0802_007127 [Mischocyttarus mexicanus]|nr:hypothetical protein M0802_007127 [Mischocyttarus mexicanus]